MSILDGEIFNQRQGFPESDEDVKKLFGMVQQAIGAKEVQQEVIKGIRNNPNNTPDFIAKLSAMLAFRMIAQVKEELQVEMPEQNVIGLIMVIVSELFEMAEDMGAPEISENIISATAQQAAQLLDQFEQQGQEGQPQQQGPPQGVA